MAHVFPRGNLESPSFLFLILKIIGYHGTTVMTDSLKTLCPYCGVGCGLEVMPPAQAGRETHRDSQGNPIWKVRGDLAPHPSSQGLVCVKGATATEPIAKDRLLYPMVRDSLDEPFRRVSWDEALDRIVNRIQTVRVCPGT